MDRLTISWSQRLVGDPRQACEAAQPYYVNSNDQVVGHTEPRNKKWELEGCVVIGDWE